MIKSFLKTFKPITPSLRHTCILNTRKLNLLKTKLPFKLNYNKKHSAGRNNQGRITVRHQGNLVKTNYKLIDFKYSILNIPGVIKTLEYNLHRSAFISLVQYANGVLLYQLAHLETKINDTIMFSLKTRFEKGNASILKYLPEGINIFNLEKNPGEGATYIRSGGTYGIILSKLSNGFVTVKLPSKKTLLFSQYCKATVGIVSNIENRDQILGKAGRSRWYGIRPTVRGVAMNPVDHPHGGGEGKKSKKRQNYNYTGYYYKGKKKIKTMSNSYTKPINNFYFI